MTKKNIAAELGSLGGKQNTPKQQMARLKNLNPGKSVLITGGTGTVGSAMVEYYLKTNHFQRIVVFSRDEFKQWQMRTTLKDSRLRFFLGDVRDLSRLQRATEGADTVIHAAALKHITAGETDPIEFVRTNVDGSANVVDACLDNNVRRVVAISTDKAVEPTCHYGATKKVMEGIILHAKAYTGHRRTSFCCVRMGNICHSRGSVIPYFSSLAKLGESLPITDLGMTRYWVTKEQVTNLIHSAVMGNESVYLPEPVSFRLKDLVSAYRLPHHIIGLRDNEKLHEKLDSETSSEHPERFMTVEELRGAIRAS